MARTLVISVDNYSDPHFKKNVALFYEESPSGKYLSVTQKDNGKLLFKKRWDKLRTRYRALMISIKKSTSDKGIILLESISTDPVDGCYIMYPLII